MTTTSMAPEASPPWTNRSGVTEHRPDDHGKDSLLGRIVAQLCELTGTRAAWVVRVDEAAGTWAVDVGSGPGRPPDGLVAAAVRDRAPVQVVDAATGHVVLGVPVRRGPRVVGACVVASGGGFSPVDRSLAVLLADYAALALADHGSLAGRPLTEAVRHELAWVEASGEVHTDLVTVGSGTLDAERAEEVFRVLQEALVNVVAHAGAGRVQVGVMHGPGTVTVLVQDDGRGFDASRHGGLHEAVSGARLGLGAMTARARRLDGELEIDSGEGRGTLLRLTVPCGGPGPVAPGRPRPSVLVAAGRPVVRAGVVRLLQLGAPELGMVSEIDLGTATHDLAEVCRLLGPDVLVVEPEVLADPATGDLAGALERLARVPDAPAVVLLTPGCPDDALRVAVTGGVKGCVGPDDGDRLVDTVAAAGRGETSFGPDQLGRLAAAPRTGGVTAREREVCRLVARGLTDRQIASALSISAKTVEKHVGSLLRKTGARNRTMLVGFV